MYGFAATLSVKLLRCRKQPATQRTKHGLDAPPTDRLESAFPGDHRAVTFRIVEFPSEGATLRGRLYGRGSKASPAPVVIMAHGTSATITMAIDRYAEVFHAAGFAVLLYDHRN